MLFSSADAAEILGQDPMLLNRLVQWCDVKDHAGVRGEANRLLASIVRHNRSQVWIIGLMFLPYLSPIFKDCPYSMGLNAKLYVQLYN